MDYDLGYFDLKTRVLEPLKNPFGPSYLRLKYVVLPMCPGRPTVIGRGGGDRPAPRFWSAID